MRGSILLLLAALLPLPLSAAPHSDEWCADAVDFAMRTVERREEGKTLEFLTQSIKESPWVFKQQFPGLEPADMQDLVTQVFKNRWTRFTAARATARSCSSERDGGASAPKLQLHFAPDVVAPAITGARS